MTFGLSGARWEARGLAPIVCRSRLLPAAYAAASLP